MAENTFFSEIHRELGAKTAPVGKWDLPLFYPGGAVGEHRHTRNGTSLFDFTGTGCWQVIGKDAGKVLDKLLVRSCINLSVGEVMENFFLRDNGIFSAAFVMCRMQEDDFMFLMDRNVPERECEYFKKILQTSLNVRDLSGNMAQLAVAGKNARQSLSTAGAVELPGYGQWRIIILRDEEGDEFRCIAVSRRFVEGSCYHLCFNADYALEVYGALYRIQDVAPAGVNAWESLRIESMVPGVAAELIPGTPAVECGLENLIEVDRDFYGKPSADTVVEQYRLLALGLDRHPLPAGTAVLDAHGMICGEVTSSAFCPSAGNAVALCRVKNGTAIENGKLECRMNDDPVCCFSILSDRLPLD